MFIIIIIIIIMCECIYVCMLDALLAFVLGDFFVGVQIHKLSNDFDLFWGALRSIVYYFRIHI